MLPLHVRILCTDFKFIQVTFLTVASYCLLQALKLNPLMPERRQKVKKSA